jgi:hypothetical protein
LIIHHQIVVHEKEIDYFITKGKYIGSFRYHDVISRDTDIDIFIPYSSVFKFKNSFKQLKILTDGNNTGICITENTIELWISVHCVYILSYNSDVQLQFCFVDSGTFVAQ